jgi:hypothetical protein
VLYVVGEAPPVAATTRLAGTVAEAAAKLEDESVDVIYFEDLTDYSPLREAVLLLWPKIKRGGVIAGTSFCDYGDVYTTGSIKITTTVVPRCGNYTLTSDDNRRRRRQRNMRGTVRAVLEAHSLLLLGEEGGGGVRHSKEDDAEEQAAVAVDPTMTTRAPVPSWFFAKPTVQRRRGSRQQQPKATTMVAAVAQQQQPPPLGEGGEPSPRCVVRCREEEAERSYLYYFGGETTYYCSLPQELRRGCTAASRVGGDRVEPEVP